jgi:thiol-disulfide isomerase/thioredoxin
MLALLCALIPALGPVVEPQLDTSTWRAWFDLPDGPLPFGLELEHEGETWTGFLVNGKGRVPIDVVTWDGQELLLELSAYDSRIRATLDGDGKSMLGEWEKVRGPDKVARLPFHALRGQHDRFPMVARAVLPKNVGGRWAVQFSSDEQHAVGVFEQAVGSHEVTGTFLTHTGDYRWLAGCVDGNVLQLSCFDGGHAFLFRAEIQADGSLDGTFHSGDWWSETWTARRDDEVQLDDAFEQTSWTERPSLANLVFPDLNGHLRSLAEPEFAGRGYVLQVFGSWCPNCHDETKYLVELHERYAGRGLSIIGLAFELTGEFERDREQVEIFRRRYGVPYPTFLVGTSVKKQATQAFGYVDFVRSFPTTIFMRPDGTVKAVHSGFVGAATGAEHQKLREEFELLIDELLSEESSEQEVWKRISAHPWSSDTEFAGATYTFEESGGKRVAHYVQHGSGVLVIEERTLPVRISGDAVIVGEQLWRLDSEAGVLLDPLRFDGRLYPERGSRTPLIGERAPLPLLAADDPVVRREAIVALVDLRRGEASPEIVALLDDASLEVRLAAAWAAGELYEKSAEERLLELLEHPNARLRLTTLRSLTRMGRRNPALLLRLKIVEDDPVQTIREHLEEVLGPGGY